MEASDVGMKMLMNKVATVVEIRGQQEQPFQVLKMEIVIKHHD